MSAELLASTWQNAVQTASYLLAYNYVLVLAPAIHLVLLALRPGRRGWLGDRRGPFAAGLLGLTEPLSRASFEDNLRRFSSSGAAVAYLGVSHALTAYAWVLLGPLLGKDFLLSHAVGVVLFVLVAAGLMRLAGLRLEPGTAPADRRQEATAQTLGGAMLRYVGLAALGLGLGGVVATWGLSAWARAPAEIGTGGLWTQGANGAVGLALALLAVPPVANLFVGTYLWKVGLAHAGIVAFLCAATAAPTRWRLYSRLYGRRRTVRLVGILLAAALLAGLVTSWSFGALELSIRYKLISDQLW